ncbi:multicopper oxidase family protein [Gudongella sp. DL1XJH-153]|uniref:multicopper oxidase family protein n=1 Tax=Gudongella sp. DL1XJH-153 TaxID=3409804 RepID=UPI003BB7DD49
MKKLIVVLAGLAVIVWGMFFFMNRQPQTPEPVDQIPIEEPDTGEIESPVLADDSTLPIPPLLEDTDPSPDRAEFRIIAQNGTKEFVPGVQTDTMGYNGNYLGPVIRTRRGEDVAINIENRINGEMTTIHWHGLEVGGEDDGGPHSGIQPGETWTPEFTIDQPAATLWYHPHPESNTGRQVYKGLAGLFIIDDEVSDSLDIPKEYGINDIPLVIQDKRFREDGTFEYILGGPDIMFGIQGNVILANGEIEPYLNVEKGLMRFRILNGSNATIFELGLDNDQSFHQIASDGGFLEEPVEMNRLVLGPSERAEILIDFSDYEDGEIVRLANQDWSIMEFVVDGGRENDLSVPVTLAEIDRLDPQDASRTREFVFLGMGPNVNINGKQFDMDRIDEVVSLGDTEIWVVSNQSGMGMMGGTVHPFHAHGTQFQILDLNGNPPAANETGWKDSFVVYPGETVRAIATFKKTGVFMYHCHILEHEDAGMMGQFVVE